MVKVVHAPVAGDVGPDAPAAALACQGRNGHAEDQRRLRTHALCRKVQDGLLHLGNLTTIKLVEFLRHAMHN